MTTIAWLLRLICAAHWLCIAFGSWQSGSAWLLSQAIAGLVQKSFVAQLQLRSFNFYAHATQPARMHFFDDVVTHTLHALNNNSNRILIGVRLGRNNYLRGDNERHFSILLVDSMAALSFLYTQLASYHLHVSGWYIIVLQTFHSSYYDQLVALSQLNWRTGVINANILVHALPTEILLFSSFPYNRHHCGGTAPVLANRYTVVAARWQHQENFFPDKLGNFHGCPVVCATWQDMPYLAVTERGQELCGIEGKLLEYLATKLNFNIEFRWLNANEIEATLADDSATFNALFEAGVDFAIGAYHYKPTQPNDSYALTRFYRLSAYNFIVSAYPAAYGSFLKLMFPFAKDIWLLLALLFASGAIVALLLHGPSRRLAFGQRNRTPVYNMFVVSLGGGVPALPSTHAARQLLWLWLTLTLLLRSSYQALMYHFIRADIAVPPPRTLDELVAKNYSYWMSAALYNQLHNVERYRGRTHRLNGSEAIGFELMRSHADRPWAMLSAYEYFGHWRRTHTHEAADLYAVPERLFTAQLSIYMRRNSILLRHFNRQIHQYLAVGLMDKWANELIDSKGWQSLRRSGDEEPQVMRLHQLVGAFHLLSIGLALSCLALCVELLGHAIGVGVRKLCACGRRFLRL